jgi:tetratricopeptide (TPR) repeat protein
MSPKVEHFNIGMTLWHELAHVFHIQLSKSRVPRWFTEGLAEYETLVARPEWRREYDADLYDALSRGKVPPLAQMNTAFSHAEDMGDMATAYYASTQVVAYIAERYGMQRIRRMLELWGEGKRTPEVLREGLGSSPEEIDQGFRSSLSARLSKFKNQFSPDAKPPDLALARATATASPRDAESQARLALALMAAGEEKPAEAAVETALKLNPKQPLALWLRAQFAAARGDRAVARDTLLSLVNAGYDGYTVRIALTEAAASPADRRAQLEAARGFDPSAAPPLKALAELANASHDEDAELDALRSLVALEENNGKAHRRLLEILIARSSFDDARKVGEAAVYVDIENAGTHLFYAKALAGAGARKEAIFELESVLKCPATPEELFLAHSRLAELLGASGNQARAREHKKAAADIAKGQGEKLGPI